jgi:hypothetical protein
MPDFAKSFQNGLDAAKAAIKARTEIDGVFSEMNMQLESASNGAAHIRIRDLHEMVTQQNDFLQALGGLAASMFVPKEKRRYKAIVIEHRQLDGFRAREIARWRQDEAGYPCWIILEGQETACGDKITLERELELLAGTARMGEAVLAAMNYKPTPKPAVAEPSQPSPEPPEPTSSGPDAP